MTSYAPRKEMDKLLNLIKTWIATESGPQAKFSIPALQTQVTIRGYKKLTLERKFIEVEIVDE